MCVRVCVCATTDKELHTFSTTDRVLGFPFWWYQSPRCQLTAGSNNHNALNQLCSLTITLLELHPEILIIVVEKVFSYYFLTLSAPFAPSPHLLTPQQFYTPQCVNAKFNISAIWHTYDSGLADLVLLEQHKSVK